MREDRIGRGERRIYNKCSGRCWNTENREGRSRNATQFKAKNKLRK